MAGYKGYSMSNNAVQAYQDGEKPLSKWSKQAVKEYIAKDLGIRADQIGLKKPYTSYLYISSWHHTSKYYNRTKFYSVDYDMEDLILSDEVMKLIAIRAKEKEQEMLRKAIEEQKRKEQKRKEHIERLPELIDAKFGEILDWTKRKIRFQDYKPESNMAWVAIMKDKSYTGRVDDLFEMQCHVINVNSVLKDIAFLCDLWHGEVRDAMHTLYPDHSSHSIYWHNPLDFLSLGRHDINKKTGKKNTPEDNVQYIEEKKREAISKLYKAKDILIARYDAHIDKLTEELMALMKEYFEVYGEVYHYCKLEE